MIASRSCAPKIDLEPGARSTTSVFALSAKENLMAARWKSAALAIANTNCADQPKVAIQGHIYGSTERHRSCPMYLNWPRGVLPMESTNTVSQRGEHPRSAYDPFH